MSEHLLLSVIIPLYNCETYIQRCIQSVLAQTYFNWEVIILDDGSTDNSIIICKKTIGNDKRFQLIYKNNEGVSITRNKGIQAAKGDFILFLDADDYLLDKNCFDKLLSILKDKQLDFIRFEYKAIDNQDNYLFNNKNKYLRRKYYYKTITPSTYCNKVAMDEFFLCFSLFKTSIIKNNNIRFLDYCRMREDADFIIRYLAHCRNVSYIPNEFYAYRKHQNAATSLNQKNYETDLKMVFDSLNSFKNECTNSKYKTFLFKFLSTLAAEQKNSRYAKYYHQIVEGFPIQSMRYKLSKWKIIEKNLFILTEFPTKNKYMYKHLREIRYKDQTHPLEVVPICVLFLILPPILGLPFIIYWISTKNRPSKSDYLSFIICISFYFSAINATKRPGGDQWQYWAAYMNVPKVGFIKSLIYIYGFDIGKGAKDISGEFMNGVYN